MCLVSAEADLVVTLQNAWWCRNCWEELKVPLNRSPAMALWHRGTWEGCPHEIRATRAVGSRTANQCTCMVHPQSAEAQEAGCSADTYARVGLFPGRALHETGTTQLLFGSL